MILLKVKQNYISREIGVSKGFPLGVRLARCSSDRQIEKLNHQIKKTNPAPRQAVLMAALALA